MKTLRIPLLIATIAIGAASALAQSSLPAPGGVAGSFGGPGPCMTPPPAYGPAWGSPWYNDWGPGWGYAPIVDNTNSGTTRVVGCGYDAQGVWRVIPMKVAYTYNGLQYNVTVLNAWNPWTDTWSYGVDQPAYNTSYYLRGQTYNFYAPLSTGTYYFNL